MFRTYQQIYVIGFGQEYSFGVPLNKAQRRHWDSGDVGSRFKGSFRPSWKWKAHKEARRKAHRKAHRRPTGRPTKVQRKDNRRFTECTQKANISVEHVLAFCWHSVGLSLGFHRRPTKGPRLARTSGEKGVGFLCTFHIRLTECLHFGRKSVGLLLPFCGPSVGLPHHANKRGAKPFSLAQTIAYKIWSL